MTALLTKSSSKLDKSQNDQWLNKVMYLDPNYNKDVCKGASKGCKASCLIYSGRMGMQSAQNARQKRTKLYFDNRELFMLKLKGEIYSALADAMYDNKKLAVRLNGTSDLDFADVYKEFPQVQFYEYTKRMDLIKRNKDIPNLHYTFSKHENHSLDNVKKVLSQGINVTVVYNGLVPKQWQGLDVIDGDKHDRRFEDKTGKLVGLKLKGTKQAKQSAIESGFAV
jgi:hypothetical protein